MTSLDFTFVLFVHAWHRLLQMEGEVTFHYLFERAMFIPATIASSLYFFLFIC